MAEQQNSGTENKGNLGNQSTGSTSGSGASTQKAKDETSTGESAGTLGNVTNKVKGLYQTAADSEVGKVAKDALGQVKENATTAIDDRKANLAQGLTSVADTLRQVGDSVKSPEGETPNKVAELTTQYTESLSQQVEKISGYLERQDLSGLVSDLESFARRNPAIFLGGAFALGILAARFLKSPTPNNQALIKASDVSDFGGGSGVGNGLTSTPSSLGGASTGSSFNETSENPYGGVTGIGDIGDKSDSFGETSGSLGGGTGGSSSTGQFNTGSGAGSSSTTGTTGSTGTGSTGTGSSTTTGSTSPGSTGASSTSTPKPSNKTGGDFGSSNS